MKQALSLPQSLCNDYALRGQVSTVNGHLPLNKPPLAQYSDAQGFSYAWGQLLERRMDNQVLWDFCLEALLDRCHHHGLLLSHLQVAVLSELEAVLPELIGYEWEASQAYRYGWRFYPGTVISAVTLRCHFSREQAARRWLSETFLPLWLPGILYKVQCHVDSQRP